MSKHLVLLSPGFPLDEEDSCIIPALQIYVKQLKEDNKCLKISVIAFQYPFEIENYKWQDIHVIALNGRNKKKKKIAVWIRAYRALKKLHKQTKIDVVHSFWLRECSFVGEFFTKKNSIKHVITAMGQDVLTNNRYVKFCSKHSSIITLSGFHQKIFKDNYGLDSTIIPWGLDMSEFPAMGDRVIDILGVGSLNKVKNYDLFIKVIERLHRKGLTFNVEIAGGGTKEKHVVRQIKTAGLEQVIKLLGEIDRKSVLKKMAQSKVLLHTSSFESFGMVFIEALCSGMSIVSKEVGIAKKSDKWLVCSSEVEMEEALFNYLTQEIEPISELNYDVKETVKQYNKIYNLF